MSTDSISIFEQIGTLDDKELVAYAIDGSEDTFEELVKRYQRPIVSYVYRMLNDYDASLDVAQEVFVKVFNSLHRYRSEYKFSTWLYRIAHNAAIDHIRRQSNKLQSIETETEEGTYQIEIESKMLSPEAERERDEWRIQVDLVINCLPASYRELIVLRHAKDLSYTEIADITKLPLGTVKNRLFRAREMMRDMLIERGLVTF